MTETVVAFFREFLQTVVVAGVDPNPFVAAYGPRGLVRTVFLRPFVSSGDDKAQAYQEAFVATALTGAPGVAIGMDTFYRDLDGVPEQEAQRLARDGLSEDPYATDALVCTLHDERGVTVYIWPYVRDDLGGIVWQPEVRIGASGQIGEGWMDAAAQSSISEETRARVAAMPVYDAEMLLASLRLSGHSILDHSPGLSETAGT